MNENEILTMEAGRELDALIAEVVMGLVWWRRGPDAYILLPPDDDKIPHYWINERPPIVTEDVLTEPLAHYSTDIGAAFRVVERLRRANDGPFLFSLHDVPQWYAKFHDEHGEVVARSGFCATAPLAICRAALLAVTASREL